MGSWPTLQLQVAPGYSPTQTVPSGGWVDVVDQMRSANPKRGRQRQLDEFSVGTMPLAMSNADRLLDPLDPSGPYFGAAGLKPGMPVRLLAVWSGTTYPLWTGFVDAFELDWPANREAVLNLPCSDVFARLGTKKVNNAGYSRLVLADSPRAYYRLSDPPGSTVMTDSSGNGLDGAYYGTPIFGVPGALMTDVDTATHFDGYVSSAGWAEGAGGSPPSAYANGTGDFSIEMIFLGTIFQRVLAQRDENDWFFTGDTVTLLDGTTRGSLSFTLQDGTGGATVGVSGDTVVNNDNTPGTHWHHVVATRQGPTLKLYYDGDLIDTVVDSTTRNVVGGLVRIANQGAATVDEVALYPSALSAADVAAHYAAAVIPWDGQTTGDRLNSVADVVQVPAAARNIDTGTVTLAGVTQTLTGEFALPYMQTVAKCEIGRLFVAADGRLTFHDANRDASHATSLATLTDADPTTGHLAGGALPYQPGGVKLRWDLTEVASEVQVTRTGGVTQIAVDPRDPPPYGDSTLDRSGLPLLDDGQAAALAAALLDIYKNPRWRIPPVVLDPRATDALWPHVLGREIGDMVTVLKQVPGLTYTAVGRIEGIEHKIDAQTRTWKTTWTIVLYSA